MVKSIQQTSREREVSNIVAFASGVSLGVMMAGAQAITYSTFGFSFQLSVWTPIAFLVGFSTVFIYLRVLLTRQERTPRAFRWVGLVILSVLTLGSLLYPLRPATFDKLAQRFAGVAMALCFIGICLFFVWRLVRAASLEEEKQEAEEHHGH